MHVAGIEQIQKWWTLMIVNQHSRFRRCFNELLMGLEIQSGHCSCASRINFSIFFLSKLRIKKRIGKDLLFSQITGIVPLLNGSKNAIHIRQLDRIESISPVGNIVTEVRMSVGDDTVDVLCFRNCYYHNRWLMWQGNAVRQAAICRCTSTASCLEI